LASAAVTSTEELERNVAAILGLADDAFRQPTAARKVRAHVKRNRFAYSGVVAATSMVALLMSNIASLTEPGVAPGHGFAQNSVTIPIAPAVPAPPLPMTSASTPETVNTVEPAESDNAPTQVIASEPKRQLAHFAKTRLARADRKWSRGSRALRGHGRRGAGRALFARHSSDRGQSARPTTRTARKQTRSYRIASARNQGGAPIPQSTVVRSLATFDETTVTSPAQINRRAALDALRALRRQ
jgi:hypothetical protein